MRGHQTGLRPASVEATAFFDDLGRYRYGMKMKRQEKDRKKQQQPDDAAASRGAGFHAGMDHNQLSTRVRIGCQSQKPSPRFVRLVRESLKNYRARTAEPRPGLSQTHR